MDYSQEQFFKLQQAGEGMMYQMGYPMQSLYMSELEYQQDMERMKSLYPDEVRRIQELVEEECDKMEYDGSMMFDEVPDHLMLRRICDRIHQRLNEQPGPSRPPMQLRPDMQPMPMEPRPGVQPVPAEPPQPMQSQTVEAQNRNVRNLIEVLLFNEMFNRRCRHRRCRRWW